MVENHSKGGSVPLAHALRINPDIVANRVGDQIVIVHIKTDRIFSLNPTASRFWELLSSGMGKSEIHSTLLQEFNVPKEQLATEIENILSSLKNEGIVLGTD